MSDFVGRGTPLGTITIELRGAPMGKGRPRFHRASGHAYTPGPTREYETNLKYAAQVAMAGRPPLEGPLTVSIVAIFPVPESWSDRRRRLATSGQICPTVRPDSDNIMKMCDALNQVVWQDDKQVVDVHVRKVYGDVPGLRIEVDREQVAAAALARGERLILGKRRITAEVV